MLNFTRARQAAQTLSLIGLVIYAAPGPAGAAAFDELTVDQQTQFAKGEQVFITEDKEGAPWPATNIYQFIDATPEQAAAVFTDYELGKSYIPNLKKSTISAVIDPVTRQVDYIFAVPVFLDESYTVEDRISTYDDGNSYRIDWKLVVADSTKDAVGHARFESYTDTQNARNGTLMAYYNFSIPGSVFAGLGFIERLALQRIRDTADAIVNQIETERKNDPELLENQVEILRAALAP